MGQFYKIEVLNFNIDCESQQFQLICVVDVRSDTYIGYRNCPRSQIDGCKDQLTIRI